jgi:hypothetical protein
MRLRLICVLLVSAAGLRAQGDRTAQLKAFHERNDQAWAYKSGLLVSQVRALRMAVGIEDTTDGLRIVNLDVASLKSRNQILLVDGICLRVHVLEPNGDGYREVWSLSEMPAEGWKADAGIEPSGRRICPQAPDLPSAHGTADGRIVLDVPVMLDPFEHTIPVRSFTYAWDGSTYKRADETR